MIRKIKKLFSFAIILIVLACGYVIYQKTQYVSYTDTIVRKDSKVLAKVNGNEITQEDVLNYRKSNAANLSSSFTDKDILNMLIEDNLLLQAAKDEGIKVPKNEVGKLLNESKNLLEKSISTNGNNEINKIVKDLGISIEKYWSTYAPKAIARAIAIGKERDLIKNNILSEITKKNPSFTSAENEKALKDMYSKKLEELKKKYVVQIIN